MGASVTAIVEFAGTHQGLAYSLIVAVALSEALPVVGAFVPGDAIILGISALVATGALHLWPLIAAATLGAIIGDGVSYWLGHHYHHAIIGRWPLSQYPALVTRGEEFFQCHGGKSVFIARFTPGVRAIVPLIAGTLLMSPTRFYAMNVFSAIVWAPSHILAGAAIGASLVLLGAVAGRLAIFVVILIAFSAVTVWTTRYAVRRLPPLAAVGQDRLRAWAQTRDSWFSRQLLSVLDPTRKELPGLALLGAILIGSLWSFVGLLQDVVAGDPLVRANAAVFDFLQALRTAWIDQIMVAITELGGATVTIAVTLATLFWLAWRRDWRASVYEVGAVSAASLFTLLLKVTLHQPRPIAIYSGWDAFSFPSGHSTVNAALYCFLAIIVAWEVGLRWRFVIASTAALLVTAIAFSRIYLGVHWISDVLAGLAFGVAWATLLTIAYLRRNPAPVGAGGLCTTVALTLLIVGGIHIERQHAADMSRYAVREKTETMALAAWWQHGWSELPPRRIDLIGEIEEPMTFEWAGSRAALETELAAKGWTAPVPWTIRSTVAWLAPDVRLADLPVLPRLENGHQEALVMVYPVAGQTADARLVLRLWRSNVVLSGVGRTAVPLWIGTVDEERSTRLMSALTMVRGTTDYDGPRDILASAIGIRRVAMRGADFQQAGWDAGVLLGQASDR
ncbi:MAG: VTT domain-containing protein [Alphaproteobacteria bacterium]|nr:VTT domain-containing protein [Alphaproteobacteria bacterium]